MMQQAQCELFPNSAPLEAQPNPMGSTVEGRGEVGLVSADGALSQRVDEE